MSTSRKIDKICAAVLAAVLVITILFMNGESLGIQSAARVLGYEKRLFDTSTVHRVDIVMDDWDSFIENCENEEYAACTVAIDGEKFKNIGIRAKGNTSLSNVRQMGSQRYSFKLEFDQYESGKSYYGLDKLCLNNLIQDNTMMKDYLAYIMMADFGADSPLCSFVYITVNGEDWGLYLAVEGLEDSFLQRTYGSNSGELYKPDSMSFGGGRGNGKDFNMEDFQKSNEESESSDDSANSESSANSDSGNGANNSSGANNESGASSRNSGKSESGDSAGSDAAGGFPEGNFPGGDFPGGDFSGGQNGGFDAGNMPQGMPEGGFPGGDASGGFPGGDFPGGQNGGFDAGNMPQGMPEGGFPGGDTSGGFPGGDVPEGFQEGNFSGGDFPGGDFPGGMSGMSRDGSAETGDSDAAAAGSTAGESAAENGGNSDGESRRSGFGGGFGGFGGMFGSDDVKLKYVDDDPDSYSNIFNNAKTDVTKADQKRLIASLKNLTEYTDLENTVDMDEVLRYFVVHNFVCNGDSYTGTMIHNYYLHEQDGKLAMIPWDYNLAYGTFQANDAEGTVNSSIDEPISRGDVNDRPMVGWIFSDEEYIQQYHALFSEFLERWLSDGQLASLIEETAELIRPYVEKDPTKFCTTEEFEAGVSAITEFVTLRAEAVSRQLQGDETTVETGDLNLSDMGSMSMGGGHGGFGQGMSGGFDFASMINATDKDGNAVTLRELIGDSAEIASVELSDGTAVDLAGGDFRSLMKTDFSTAVSVTDKDGNVTDLSGYTISVNMPDRGSRRGDSSNSFSGAPAGVPGNTPGDGASGGEPADASGTSATGETPANAPADASEQTPGGSAANEGSGNASEGANGTGMPSGAPGEMPSEMTGKDTSDQSGEKSSGMPSGMPGGQSQDGGRSGGMPSGMPSGMPGMPGGQTQNSEKTTWILVGASVLVLAVGLVIAVKKKGLEL